MPFPVNEDIAGLLEEVARVFSEQGANRFRVKAYECEEYYRDLGESPFFQSSRSEAA